MPAMYMQFAVYQAQNSGRHTETGLRVNDHNLCGDLFLAKQIAG
jgi:hypothetical protein